MGKFACIHGHFYQPPRENPWLEAVELQDSALPYHDWNERIAYECYAPNARSRLLDGEGRIRKIVNNYSRISFNFGPTLLSWLKDKMPDVHQAIVDADKKSRERFSGHGSALAQCFNHMIMPLANTRDKHTQVLWGIADFKSRFGRDPEGMWLPETAADNESLDVLAEHGIKFTVLSPYQASRIRPLSGGDWQDVNGARIDTTQPYLVKLASGRSIAVFFYDALIAKAIAFEQLLLSGEELANRLIGAFGDRQGLVNVATDGESYGHHFRHGDMALAFALDQVEHHPDVKLTVYGEFLEKNPPTQEVEIHQPSAWSCSHGVDRWKRDCGCNSGGHSDWNQQWREPLRNALDVLRDRLVPLYETKAGEFLKDPWAARDDYISVILDRSDENVGKFMGKHASHDLTEGQRVTVLRLLEMQRQAMLMFTSCGWFFDEISGIETTQVIQYAARALQLASELGSEDLEPDFLHILEGARSNIPDNQNGRTVYEWFAKPAVMTRESFAAHFAISSMFESYPAETTIHSYRIHQENRESFTVGNVRLALGRIKVTFVVTRASDELTYMVVHMGDHNLNCGVRPNGDEKSYKDLVNEARTVFERADFPELIRILDRNFGTTRYSLKNLFRDEQRKVLNQILSATRDEIHNAYRVLTDRFAPLSRFLNDIYAPPLNALAPATEFVLNSELRKQFDNGHVDAERVKSLLAEGRAVNIHFDTGELGYTTKKHFDRLSETLARTPEDINVLRRLCDSAGLIPLLPYEVNLWIPQNTYYQLAAGLLPEMQRRNDDASRTWIENFEVLGHRLNFAPDLKPEEP
ncbi:MAG TPA: DUF3536 domain-containing protein, partial [Desulfuromonadaceae bacterium]|nr:DUF3536 domain-containing protein [Desulfuromonadaceae bacterium]